MKFEQALIKATLVKRYKRFLADARLEDGQLVTAYCPNTGSMLSCATPGDTIYLALEDKPARKLKYTWELSQTQGGFIGINTSRPNNIVAEAIAQGRVEELKGYEQIQREVKCGKSSRLDLRLEKKAGKPCWVEVKNVTLLSGDSVAFPDAVSLRATKHIKELMACLEAGDRAVLFFLVNRPEGAVFRPAKEIDPNYASELQRAAQAGLEILAYRAQTQLDGVSLGEAVPIQLD